MLLSERVGVSGEPRQAKTAGPWIIIIIIVNRPGNVILRCSRGALSDRMPLALALAHAASTLCLVLGVGGATTVAQLWWPTNATRKRQKRPQNAKFPHRLPALAPLHHPHLRSRPCARPTCRTGCEAMGGGQAGSGQAQAAGGTWRLKMAPGPGCMPACGRVVCVNKRDACTQHGLAGGRGGPAILQQTGKDEGTASQLLVKDGDVKRPGCMHAHACMQHACAKPPPPPPPPLTRQRWRRAR
jgi:hypothetical protein